MSAVTTNGRHRFFARVVKAASRGIPLAAAVQSRTRPPNRRGALLRSALIFTFICFAFADIRAAEPAFTITDEFVRYIESATNPEAFGLGKDGRFRPYSTPLGRRIGYRQAVWDEALYTQGCSKADAEKRLREELQRTLAQVKEFVATNQPAYVFDRLSPDRQEILVDIASSEGVAGLKPELLAAVAGRDWQRLLDGMLYIRKFGSTLDNIHNRAFAQRWIESGRLVSAKPTPAGLMTNALYRVTLGVNGGVCVMSGSSQPREFRPRFTVFATERDPQLTLRWGDWGDPVEKHLYNVLTWSTGAAGKVELKAKKAKHVEDGFDPASDQAKDRDRTMDAFKAAPAVTLDAVSTRTSEGRIEWLFAEQPDFTLRAAIELPAGQAEPLLRFEFTPKTAKWFSVAYTGAPEVEPAAMDEMWQPMIWQEKRFPNQAFLTESGRCTLPATLVANGGAVCGVVADPSELPFMPMPKVANSLFGVAVRNAAGQAQSTLFAPIMGGVGSQMKAGEPFAFKLRLVVLPGRIVDAYEALGRGLYCFRDQRRNDGLGSLNRTLERTVDYAMSKWARFNDDLRGCTYETDVPGAVKNVSALHPLSIAIITDDAQVFERQARPIMEYLMSREKFLFVTDPKIKGQNASAKLEGPCAPVSELTALYAYSGRRTGVFLTSAETLFGKTRTLNLDAAVRGDIWQNALALFRATGDKAWLARAQEGADAYLKQRLATPQSDFKDDASRGMFFWTSYAPNWMELYELFSETGERRYLDASHEGARRFSQFVWMCPVIPEGDVRVNEGGLAPFYRTGPKFPPYKIAEESVPAWRVSELGLTPESSGTCKGHRAVLLATHAPWMLRLAQQTGDTFLHDIARSAIVGRYTSFPGYHMNTARTTVYEKPDFAERSTEQLNTTTSLHYNHIWPHIAMLMDYLMADAAYRSKGAIEFPSQYAEGYAYLQERVYGHAAGVFYGERDVMPWMPKGLLTFDSPEINYVAARGRDTLYLALMNQSFEKLSTTVRLDAALASFDSSRKYTARVWRENKPEKTVALDLSRMDVEIAPQGITAFAIEGLALVPKFQQKMGGNSAAWKKDAATLELGGTHAMVLNFGTGLKSAYVYLQADASQLKRATLHYRIGGTWQQATDERFPFEFTVPLAQEDKRFEFRIEGVKPDGETVNSEVGILE